MIVTTTVITDYLNALFVLILFTSLMEILSTFTNEIYLIIKQLYSRNTYKQSKVKINRKKCD